MQDQRSDPPFPSETLRIVDRAVVVNVMLIGDLSSETGVGASVFAEADETALVHA